eukprot:4749818-Pleurochrysis_carterae.AAC.1
MLGGADGTGGRERQRGTGTGRGEREGGEGGECVCESVRGGQRESREGSHGESKGWEGRRDGAGRERGRTRGKEDKGRHERLHSTSALGIRATHKTSSTLALLVPDSCMPPRPSRNLNREARPPEAWFHDSATTRMERRISSPIVFVEEEQLDVERARR